MLPPGHPNTLYPQIGLARTFTSLERYAEAEPLLLGAAGQCVAYEASRRMHWEKILNARGDLYEGRHAAMMVGNTHPTDEPGKVYDNKATERRAKLEL